MSYPDLIAPGVSLHPGAFVKFDERGYWVKLRIDVMEGVGAKVGRGQRILETYGMRTGYHPERNDAVAEAKELVAERPIEMPYMLSPAWPLLVESVRRLDPEDKPATTPKLGDIL